jgi:CRP/FNR family transcriptional regulator
MIAISPAPAPSAIAPEAYRPWKHASAGFRRDPSPLPGAGETTALAALQGLDAFADAPEEVLRRLAAAARVRQAEKEEMLLSPDPRTGPMLVLLRGEAVVTREHGDGEETLLWSLGEGELIGETALFDPDAADGLSARAATPVRLLVLPRETLLRALETCPRLALGFLGEMARRLQRSHRRVSGICNRRAPGRVAAALLSLLEDRGLRLKEGGRTCLLLRRRPPQRQIADLSGTRRETVSRLLSRWERLGWLCDKGGDLTVFEEARLRGMAGEE